MNSVIPERSHGHCLLCHPFREKRAHKRVCVQLTIKTERKKERKKEGKKERRKEGKKERRKEGKKERRKEGKKERRKEGKKDAFISVSTFHTISSGSSCDC